MMSKRLNFYPYYEEVLVSRQKTTTLRVGERVRFQEGERLMLSVGWDEKKIKDLHEIEIVASYFKTIKDLDEADLDGESKDCSSAEAARQVLGCVYRKVVDWSEIVNVVKFKHL